MTRMIARHGKTWTVNAWGSSTRDAYEDALPTGELTGTFKAIVNSEKEEEVTDEKGVTRTQMVTLFVLDTWALPTGAQTDLPVTVTSPEGRVFNLDNSDLSGAPVGAKQLKLKSGGGDANLYI